MTKQVIVAGLVQEIKWVTNKNQEMNVATQVEHVWRISWLTKLKLLVCQADTFIKQGKVKWLGEKHKLANDMAKMLKWLASRTSRRLTWVSKVQWLGEKDKSANKMTKYASVAICEKYESANNMKKHA